MIYSSCLHASINIFFVFSFQELNFVISDRICFMVIL